jgi:hypothetical protein
MNWKGSEGLRRFLVPVDELRPNPENARKHGADVEEIARSLGEHGQQRPVVASANGTLLAGEGRLRAAVALGWTHIAAIKSDILEEQEQLLYAIRDNRTAELSEWDRENLSDSIKYLNENDTIEPLRELWTPPELHALLEVSWTPPAAAELPQWEEPPEPKQEAGGPAMGESVSVSPETWVVFAAAAALLRKNEEEPRMSNGRALELMVADWLA